MKYRALKFIFILSLLTLPSAVLAQDFKGIVGDFTNFIESLVPFLASLALLVFFWGLFQYVSQAGGGQKVEEAKRRMMWGVVGLFVISTIWGIVSLISGSIGITALYSNPHLAIALIGI